MCTAVSIYKVLKHPLYGLYGHTGVYCTYNIRTHTLSPQIHHLIHATAPTHITHTTAATIYARACIWVCVCACIADIVGTNTPAPQHTLQMYIVDTALIYSPHRYVNICICQYTYVCVFNTNVCDTCKYGYIFSASACVYIIINPEIHYHTCTGIRRRTYTYKYTNVLLLTTITPPIQHYFVNTILH